MKDYLKKIVLFMALLLIITPVVTACSGNGPESKPPIPSGFTHVSGTWDKGFVIQDSFGNQFVWVPVGDISEGFIRREWPTKYKPWYRSLSQISDNVPAIVTKAINKTGGFYVARYEASQNGNKAQSKANQKPWMCFKWDVARKTSENMANDYGYKGVYTHLLYDTEWDCMVRWIDEHGYDIEDSRIYGNFADDSQGEMDGIKNTGSSWTKTNNLFDLAGNLWEWTMAGSGKYGSPDRLCRGGGHDSYGDTDPVSARFNITPSVTNYPVGFRPAFVVVKADKPKPAK